MKKTVIITGSSRGIGAATALEFAKNGYNVVVNYNNSKDRALELLEKIRSEGVMAIALKADVSKPDEAKYLVEKTLEEFGRIDVLVNNAGIAEPKLFTDMTFSEWQRMFDVNVNGMFNCTQPVVKHMLKKHDGKIINIASILGISGASCEVHYSAAKAAVIGFTKALAKELGPSNITVNCVAPGVIDTEMGRYVAESIMQKLKAQTPLGRTGKAEEIAKAILFLAGDNANFFTGQVLSPNGGFVI